MTEKPCKQKQFFKYSPQWAQEISGKLLGKYARAAEILGEETDIDIGKIWMYLARGHKAWPILRTILQKSNLILVKLGELGLRQAIRTCTTTQLLSGLEAENDNSARFDTWEDLTELSAWLTLRAQGFRGS